MPPEPAPTAAAGTPQIRLGSIDAYRGFVMLLMMAEVLHLSTVAKNWPEISWRKPFWASWPSTSRTSNGPAARCTI